MNGVIHYMVGGEDRYLVGRESLTQSEYDAQCAATAAKDEEYRYHDRMNGIYDKWYRYNRRDDGAAYDRGQQRAAKSKDCPNTFNIIGG